MDKIKLYTDIKCGDYYEFHAGTFEHNHWNKGAVFLQDEVFHYLEPTIRRHVPNLDWYGPTEIGSEVWKLIIADLQELEELLGHAKNIQDVEGRIRFVRPDTGKTEFAQDFEANKRALQCVICELVKWLQSKLDYHATVWVLGI
jgi:hypothetical protein